MPTPWRAAAASRAGSSDVAGQVDEHVEPAAAPGRTPVRELTREGGQQRLAASRVAQAHAPEVTLELAAGDEVGESELPGDLRARVLDRLRGDQGPGEPRRREHPAEAHARRQALARRADVEHAVRGESLERADALAAELGVVVVLDDQPVAALGPLDQRGAALGAEHGAGRELVRRRHDHHVRAARAERPDVDPVRVDRDRRRLEARLLDDQALGVPARAPRARRARSRWREASGRPARGPGESPCRSGGARDPPRRRGRGRGSRLSASRSSGNAAWVAVADRVQRRLAPRAAQRAKPAIPRESGEIRKPGAELVGEPREQRTARLAAELARGPRARRGPARPAGSADSPRRRADRRPTSPRRARHRAPRPGRDSTAALAPACKLPVADRVAQRRARSARAAAGRRRGPAPAGGQLALCEEP